MRLKTITLIHLFEYIKKWSHSPWGRILMFRCSANVYLSDFCLHMSSFLKGEEVRKGSVWRKKNADLPCVGDWGESVACVFFPSSFHFFKSKSRLNQTRASGRSHRPVRKRECCSPALTFAPLLNQNAWSPEAKRGGAEGAAEWEGDLQSEK